MDLKEVVERAKTTTESAYSSFHAGRHDDSEKYLCVVAKTINEYFGVPPTPLEHVTKSATSEKSEETIEETQAKVSGPGVHPAVIDPAAAAQQVGGSLTDEKPNQ